MAVLSAPCREHFPHAADMGVRGVGDTREQAFEQAALALTSIITDPATIAPRATVAIAGQAPDDEKWPNAASPRPTSSCPVAQNAKAKLISG